MTLAASDTAQKQAQNHVETWVRSLFALHGYPAPGSDQLGGIVQQGMARISPEELRHPGAISTASLGQLDGLVRASVEVGKPQNMYGADAARAAQAVGADSARGGAGFGYIDAIRAGNSSARFREMAADSAKGTGTSGGGVTPDYARSFAGTGIVGGTLKTFAEIGLERSIYDAYRKEGFSRADIADAANTAKILNWKHDREAFDDVQRSTKAQRAAIVAINAEDDPEKRQALIDQKAKSLGIDKLPPEDQARWRRNIDRVQSKGHEADAQHGVGARAKENDETLRAERAKEQGKPAATKVRVAKLEASQAKSTKAAASTADDEFGTTVTPAKPTAVVEAKLANAAPKAG